MNVRIGPRSSKKELGSAILRQRSWIAVDGASEVLWASDAHPAHATRCWHQCVVEFGSKRLSVGLRFESNNGSNRTASESQ